MNFRECGCQFTDSLGKSVDWHPHSQNSGQGPAGPSLERVQRVQLHPSILGNGCMPPSIFRPDTSSRLFCLIFLAIGQILHPSMEISNQGTVMIN